MDNKMSVIKDKINLIIFWGLKFMGKGVFIKIYKSWVFIIK